MDDEQDRLVPSMSLPAERHTGPTRYTSPRREFVVRLRLGFVVGVEHAPVFPPCLRAISLRHKRGP